MQAQLAVKDLTLSWPDGFHVMDQAEWSKLKLLASGESAGLSDPERHIIVTVGYRQVNGFSAALLSGRDLAKNMEKQIRKSMISLDYTFTGFHRKTVGGKAAEGFRYSYISNGVSMTGESFVIKNRRELYYLHVYMRTELLESSLTVWEGILDASYFHGQAD